MLKNNVTVLLMLSSLKKSGEVKLPREDQFLLKKRLLSAHPKRDFCEGRRTTGGFSCVFLCWAVFIFFWIVSFIPINYYHCLQSLHLGIYVDHGHGHAYLQLAMPLCMSDESKQMKATVQKHWMKVALETE